ncbi:MULTISPECIES: site-specific DNA-methyltransferase [unclassified Cryobacterium]|uniref:DNA-methyltransferase n=1 Tax=unclassified Cryobacterium TaxID=2649013 RepID=UPI00106BA296|nr:MULTISPECIES: site-specific DNA-methyltransferase [unclassified Cryobacterium]TFB93010.1 site-specific DNA-methyltransferase [Cryobacterium sp. MDB2-A-1]TFC04978.1 site-specific DNA-methyltransferase [Cryobacterium sp. MDB2-33-2]TFC10650.1 site-specific DNA-methyltransferase [Cryobacterium sp. MDB2-A-2]TFC18398.1 site-specific DNA-methyltransferase [Cryobacterium sp. MDB2-10]
MQTAWSPSSPNRVVHADNLEILPALPDGAFTLIYLDPPFNTGRKQNRRTTTSVRVAAVTGSVPDPASADAPLIGVAVSSPRAGGLAAAGTITGFKGQLYERIKGDLLGYDDQFEDYWAFLEPRLIEAWRLLAEDGTLYLHLDYREAHYAKVLLDALFGRDCFLNELIWAYDYGAKSKNRWPTKHDTILVYVKNPQHYYFDSTTVDREPYMAPGLVTPEKVARGKLPTDVWWHTIVSPTGKEKTGYPTQKPVGILRRMIQASSREGDWVLDFFAGSGTTGAVAESLGRRFLLVDQNPESIQVMRTRFAALPEVEFLDAS